MSNDTLKTIFAAYPISDSEYVALDKALGNLAHFVAWDLKKKNSNNSTTNDPEDDVQQLRIALMRAGCYHKRQTYIEAAFDSLREHVKDEFIAQIAGELEDLWLDRKRHGANKQKFGASQEAILEHLVNSFVPKEHRPNKNSPLKINPEFKAYAKQIVWNEQRSLGKRITREKSWRSGLVSLSSFDYLQ